MAVKLPGAQDIGPLATPDPARPVATYDVGGIARGGAALAEAGRQLGEGVARFGAGVGELATAQSHWEYAKAHSEFLTQKIDLDGKVAQDTNYGPDDSGKTMPQRYDEELGKLRDGAAAKISTGPLREFFIQRTAPSIATAKKTVEGHARKLEGDASAAWVTTQGDDAINKGIVADDNTKKELVDAHNQLIDGLEKKGFITPQQAVAEKQNFAHRFVTADLAHKADTDPESVINTLRSKPGTPEGTVDRILQVEGDGKNSRSSATGTGQFIKETWLDVIKRNRPDLAEGRSDEQLLALRADRKLGKELTGALARENTVALQKQGLEATPGNVYLAHFLGAGGAAAVLKANPGMPVEEALAQAVGPAKAKQMVDANPEVLKGQLAGTVKQWADGKMGGQAPGGGQIYSMLKPEVREQILGRALASQQKQTTNDLTELKHRVTDAEAEAMRTGVVTKPVVLEDFVARLGAAEGAKAYEQHKAQVQLGADMTQVASLSHDDQQALLKTYDPTPGEGYADAAKRQKALETEIARVRTLRIEDPAFQTQMKESLLEAGRTGNAPKPVPKEEFISRLGSRDGPKAYAQYTAALRLGRDAQHVGELSPQEQTAMLGGYDPDLQKLMSGTDYDQALKRRDAVATAITNSNKQRDTDPAAFAIARLPSVTEAWGTLQTVLTDPTVPLDAKQAAARDFATKMEMEQARIGVPAEKRTLLPKAYVDHFQAALAKPAVNGGAANVAGAIEREAHIWGDAWPQVAGQLTKGASPVVRVIATGVAPVAAQLLTEYANTKTADIANDQSETKLAAIKKDVRDTFRPFAVSMVGTEGVQPDIDAFQAAGEKLAAHYVRHGETSAEAAKEAFKQLLGRKYTFTSEGYRVPISAGVSADQVNAGVMVARSKLRELGINAAKDSFGGLSEETLQKARPDQIARDGKFVTAGGRAQSDQGLWLVYKDQVVRGRDKQPLFLSWAKLAELGKDVEPLLGVSSAGGPP